MTQGTEADDLLARGLRELLADHCTPSVVREVEGGAAPDTLWGLIEASGFLDALVPESNGGAGLALSEVFPLLELCGATVVPAPLAQTILARGLLAQDAMTDLPTGSIAIATSGTVREGVLRCREVLYGRVATNVLVEVDGSARLLKVDSSRMERAVFPLDATLAWDVERIAQAPRLDAQCRLETVQAACIAAQIAGALMHVFQRTLQYANDRIQFGRPIGKFQAIQHQLSVLSEHTFASRMAAQIGCSSSDWKPDRIRAAVAKSRTSEAALEAAGIAHSIHGAIGFTAEFDLQLYTRRLHAWRQAAGSESYWNGVLGEALVDSTAPFALDLVRAATDLN